MAIGEPPTPMSLFTFSIAVLFAGIVDFMIPENHLGVILLTMAGSVLIVIYVALRNDKSCLNNPTIKMFLGGCGLLIISIITYFVPWLRLTSLVLFGFGIYTCGNWLLFFWEYHFKEEIKT